eukprot:2071764-Rhodomonas_salina.4
MAVRDAPVACVATRVCIPNAVTARSWGVPTDPGAPSSEVSLLVLTLYPGNTTKSAIQLIGTFVTADSLPARVGKRYHKLYQEITALVQKPHGNSIQFDSCHNPARLGIPQARYLAPYPAGGYRVPGYPGYPDRSDYVSPYETRHNLAGFHKCDPRQTIT